VPFITPTLGCRLLDASIIAYDIKDGSIDPDTPYYRHVGFKEGSKPHVFVTGDDGIDAGFVGETWDDWALVVFRGTLPPFKGNFIKWIEDWLHDFEAGPMPWTVNGQPYGHVETGFGSAVQDLWPGMSKALADLDPRSKKGVLVSGHSKGGGMSFPAAALVKGAYPDVVTSVCTFAAPLTCDRAFQAAYYNHGLRDLTVRYENMYDIVPFLPYWPTFALLAAAERRVNGSNEVITADNWPSKVENDYLPLGHLRYLGEGCQVEYGAKAREDSDAAIWQAIENGWFDKIADAHSATGRYHECVCKDG